MASSEINRLLGFFVVFFLFVSGWVLGWGVWREGGGGRQGVDTPVSSPHSSL